jgi:hypothetical protein
MRTLAAIAIAPIAVIPALTVMFGPWALAHGGWPSLGGILKPALVVAYPLLILFGLPMHLALVGQSFTRRRDYALAGLLLGAVPVIGYLVVAIVFEAQFMPSGIARASARNIEWGAIGAAVFGVCGAAVALAFRALIGQPETRPPDNLPA